MKLHKIEKLKNNKYKLVIDNEVLLTFDNVILENNLLYRKDIDDELHKKIIKDTEYYNIYNKTVKYILKKRRSEKEIVQYLTKLGINIDNIEKIILQLKRINLINDIEYCKAFINDMIYLSKKGINKIKEDLLKEGIPIEVIEVELDNVDMNIFNERLKKIILKKINTNKKYSSYQLKQKILNEMLLLGYDKEKILDILENNLNEDSDIIKKEFNKIYNKLILKNDKDVFSKVKQKLMLKGFCAEDINRLIQEKTEE